MRKQKIIHGIHGTHNGHGARLTHIAAVTTAALLALTACGTETKDGSGSGAGSGTGNRDGGRAVQTELPLTGVHWRVDSVTRDGEKTAAPPGAGVEISSEGRASAQTGCNHVSAPVTIRDDVITIGDKEATLIGCDKEADGFEKALDGALSGKLTAELQDGKKLTLTTADGDTIALTSEEPAPFAGTKWTVDSLTGKDTATSLPKGAEGKAFFTFTVSKEAQAGKDGERPGTVEGSLGCNRFKAPATVSGTTLTLGRLTATRMLCPGPAMTLERQVQKVLEGEVTYELRHRSVTLRTAEGEEIGATATVPEK
ncbi:META domain-containing protein [Streptomyces sp. NPDC059092]|uniref:META domain-containing protein n=1 Tax=Streptomyces sp. NPDC059092 TaxID=3346725 RepID=UPI003684B418